jgi:hypothetical protein
MTIGIYALYWVKQDLVYIGQSKLDIKIRFRQHISLLTKNKHTNYKVQEAYNLYGKPEQILLEACNKEQCDDTEIFWTKEFNSLHGNKGLNIIEAGIPSGWGPTSNSAKYSKLQILKVFRLLYLNTFIPNKDIATIVGVHYQCVTGVLNSKIHCWLKDKYPNSYNKMKALQASKAKLSRYQTNQKVHLMNPVIILSDNIEYEVTNLSNFSREHNLDVSSLCKLLKGKLKTTKGWTLKIV